MPTYEFRCNDTGKYFEITYKTYAEYEAATQVSPFTGKPNVTRIIRRVAIARSESSRWDRMEEGDMDALADLEDADPRTLGRTLRRLGGQLDEDMGPEFTEVVERLESGQSPEEIEATMPDLGGEGLDGSGMDSIAPDMFSPTFDDD